jgi:hypothetical protein
MSQRRRPGDGPSKLFGVHPTDLGPKEAEIKIIGCDFRARRQKSAMRDTTTGEVVKKTLKHGGNNVRDFDSGLQGPASALASRLRFHGSLLGVSESARG